MRIVLLGGGGHASDVLGALEAIIGAAPTRPAFQILGYLADGDVDLRRFEGRSIRFLGPLEELALVDATHFVSCVGYPVGRRRLAILAETRGLKPFTVVHPKAWVPPTAELGAGDVVLAGSVLSPKVRLGSHVLVGQGAIVGHDCHVGTFTSIMPGACVSGDTSIGEGCVIGAGSIVIEKLSVGDGAVVGAGAVVTRNVPPGMTVVGVPAREK